jgi:endoglycosylceramidase
MSRRALRVLVWRALIALSFVVAREPLASAAELRVVGRSFVDAGGGTVVLRGVNVAANVKIPPYAAALRPEQFDPLRDWGLDVARLLFTWEAYEPSAGQYDEAYLDQYLLAVRALRDRGLYVIVDFHQDAFSRHSVGGCGDGFPAWTIPWWLPRAAPRNDASCQSWSTAMIVDLGMHASWNAFHSDFAGVKTRYLAMLHRVATRLAREPGVLGYDMMNEPWGDEATEIDALYAAAASALRSAHGDCILFVSPHALTSSGTSTKLPRPRFDNFAFSPHFYDPGVVVLKTYLGGGLYQGWSVMQETASAWGVPLFVGEFGAAPSVGNIESYIQADYERLDDNFISGAQWSYTPGWTASTLDGWNAEDFSIVDDRGTARRNFAPRPYARRIAGAPTSFRVTPPTATSALVAELAWSHDPARGVTEVAIPRRDTSSLHVVTDGAALTCSRDVGRISCTSPVAGAKRVTITM